MDYAGLVVLAGYIFLLYLSVGLLFNSIKGLGRQEASYDSQARRENVIGTIIGIILVLGFIYLIIRRLIPVIDSLIGRLSPF